MAEFKLTYGRPESRHDIQAETLLGSLISVNELLSTVNENLDSNKSLEIRIQAPRRGSFEIDVEVIADGLGMLFAMGKNVEHAQAVLHVFYGLFGLHRFLGGELPRDTQIQQGSTMKLEDSDGNRMAVDNRTFNIYVNGDDVADKISSNFRRILKDDDIDRFSITDGNGDEQFKADREEFARLSQSVEPDPETRTEFETDVRVTVYKLAFESNYKWGVVYNGNKVNVDITDEGFFQRINSGRVDFRKGDRLIVDMVMHQVYDRDIGDFVNDSYEINNVHRRIKRNTTNDLFGDEDEQDDSNDHSDAE